MRIIRSGRAALAALAAAALLAGCGGDGGGNAGDEPETATTAGTTTTTETTETAAATAPPAESTVTLVTHDSFALSEDLLAQFTEETGCEIVTVAPGDAGALVNQLILTKNSPLGDAVYGIDSTFASRAVEEGVLAPYESPNAVADMPNFDGRLTAIDQGDVCLNVDKVWFDEHSLAAPASFEDLLEPEYQDLTVVTNPATSSPGHAFLLATIAHFGEDGWQQYWTDLLANGARVADGWSDAYYVDFSGSSGEGTRPIVLSYSSSPSAEIGDDGESRTANVEATCFRQVEFAGVLEGAENPEGAQAVVDWLLSTPVQNDIPGQMYMYPISPDATLPEEWSRFAALAEDPLWIEPAEIAANRNAWLEEWLELIG